MKDWDGNYINGLHLIIIDIMKRKQETRLKKKQALEEKERLEKLATMVFHNLILIYQELIRWNNSINELIILFDNNLIDDIFFY